MKEFLKEPSIHCSLETPLEINMNQAQFQSNLAHSLDDPETVQIPKSTVETMKKFILDARGLSNLSDELKPKVWAFMNHKEGWS